MNYNKKTIRDIDVSGKKILLRCDFNVPHDKKTGVIHDDTRIVATLPTIRYLLEHNAAVILLSHMGRPHGEWKPELSLFSARDHLEKLLGIPVPLTQDVLGPDTKEKCRNLQPGQVVLVENLRFRLEEEKNDPEFSKELASLADIFVFDAFGAAHRAHASTEGVSHYLPSVAGLLVEKELRFMGGALDNPKRPLVAILGGAKVSDKIGVINNLLQKADAIIIGGGMSYTFQAAQGGKIGTSLLDESHVEYAREMIQKAKELGVDLLLPVDNVVTPEFSADAPAEVVSSQDIPDDRMGMDIGPETIQLFQKAIENAGTVIWNGPMGVFEFPAFAVGTKAIAKSLSQLKDAVTIVGGGDSVSALEQTGFADQISHISTGGGASLEFLEGLALPGIACLADK
ncbi:MAG: phosphoglycerate kinase [Evtepia sp.]|uniref:phosphoglycerate kinase n=1 Tax=Evtepia sp. TaxID=2773933 RepID=UPI002A753723|nr:phosphoglycerate kinase [Evtepia sp.]MDY3014521.1 phosphoglycerate kinase [Evtepia sp.]